ncbi:hypothetical protein P154DRAFT_305174 [Amniculicola lignicola CBS 123094]|uniref:Zn(2)-C6 fungal-type domain-containing protein n=1 Tax=Amniculicola lignicola CBS 123094 TaxID=1392246 RepID=A0A6A5WGS9_9PLEO|nr:hypothetical protein P154DRAFT_305174 [Amniculicola lignicola CBS 123094]
MHILSLPPPTSLPPTPFRRHQEPGSLAKFPLQFSASGSEQQNYPSPPMSDSHSPARRSAQLVEPEGHPYPPLGSEAHRREGIHPPPLPPALDPRLVAPVQGAPHQRPLYPGEAPPRGFPPPHHFQAGRAIDPPPFAGVQIQQNYSYGYPAAGHGVPAFLGSQGPGPQAQPTTIIAPQPLRPHKPARRTKAHVASACVNCKKAHLSCDVQRPCGRCVASGKQESCKDVQHKKRGRPRLREDQMVRMGAVRVEQPLSTLPGPGPESFPQQSSFPSTHHTTDLHGVLRTPTRGSDVVSKIQPQPMAPASGARPASVGSYGVGPTYPAGSPVLAYHSTPVAFLNLDLVVLKCNSAFQDLVSFLGDAHGKSLAEFLEAHQTEVLHRARNELRDERDEREPTYMAPITPLGQDPVQSVADRDVDQVSQGYTDRAYVLNFRLPNGQSQPLQTQIRLAKTSVYFVTIVVHPPRPTGPPLLTQQLAPPTPVHASQTLSAPTTVPVRDFGSYPGRPSSSASSAPTSPYFNFSAVRTSLPQVNSSSYASSPSYSYSPTAGPESNYFATIQPPSQPTGYPSPYPPVSRTTSASGGRPGRLDGLQLPPIRTGPVPPLPSPRTQDFNERDRVRPRESPQSAERPETPETGKRRRLNIHEVLE